MGHAQLACCHVPVYGEEHRHAAKSGMRGWIEGMSTDELIARPVLVSEAAPGRGGTRRAGQADEEAPPAGLAPATRGGLP